MVRWRTGLALLAAGAGGFVEWAVLHNLVSALSGIEEPAFFLLALLGAPLIALTGSVLLAVAAAQRLWTRARRM